MKNQTVIVLDFGGQYKELIARRIRECKVYSVIKPGSTSIEEICAMNPIGIVLTGGPNSVYDEASPKCDKKLFEMGIPFAMLVGVVGLFESQRRFEMFKNNEFECMYLNKRVSYFKNYEDQKPNLNPPFSSIYICHKMLPKQIIFEEIYK